RTLPSGPTARDRSSAPRARLYQSMAFAASSRVSAGVTVWNPSGTARFAFAMVSPPEVSRVASRGVEARETESALQGLRRFRWVRRPRCVRNGSGKRTTRLLLLTTNWKPRIVVSTWQPSGDHDRPIHRSHRRHARHARAQESEPRADARFRHLSPHRADH